MPTHCEDNYKSQDNQKLSSEDNYKLQDNQKLSSVDNFAYEFCINYICNIWKRINFVLTIYVIYENVLFIIYIICKTQV